MAINPNNPFDITQLSKSVGYSWGKQKPFREAKLCLVKQFVGKHYSENGSDDKMPINLLELSMNIYLQRLVAKEPAISITTVHAKLKEICGRFELAGNHLIKEIDLGSTLEMAVIGAMFSMGIIKVGLNRTQIEFGGVLHDAGQPFADAISLGNWVHDMTVERMEMAQYEGDFYNLTLDDALLMFPKKHDKLIAIDEQQEQGNSEHEVSEGTATQREEFRPMIRVLDLWLPKQNLIVQCQASDEETDPIGDVLNIIEWEGPERGPYHKLGYARIESNTMPVSPAMHWRDLNELTNNVFRKLGKQAQRQKTILGVQAGADADGNRIVDAGDGDAIKLDNPASAKEYKFGGISQENYAFMLGLRDLYSYFAGNLDMLGGLGPQSETLGQDQLLSASASMRIQKMQKETIKFTKGIVEDLMFYLWNDPYINIPVTKRAKGFEDVSITVPFGPEERESDFMEYNIDIEPYSMQHVTPEAKLQGLRTIFTEMIAPMMPMMAQQGVSIDFEQLFRKMSKLGNIPEINDILIYADASHESQPFGEMPTKAPVSTRRYERVNRPGSTNQGKSKVLQQALLGGKPQQSEIASLARPTG